MDKENFKGVIEIKPEHFLIPLDEVLIECSNAVHVGLSSLDKIDELPESLSGEDNFFHFKPLGDIPLENRKRLFKSWLLKKGFEDLIRAVTLMLIDIDKILNLNSKLKGGKFKSWEEIVEVLKKPDYEPTKKDFPKLLYSIKPYLREDLTWEKEILSINRVRRCLVHRNGITSPIDYFEGEPSLKLKWIFLKYVFVSDGKEIEFTPPVVILDGAGEIEGRNEKKEREYLNGEKIDFDFLHFNELIHTCKVFSLDLINKITLERKKTD
jgi:hypothetical protein